MISDENLHKPAVLAPYFEGDGKWTEDDWRWQYASYDAEGYCTITQTAATKEPKHTYKTATFTVDGEEFTLLYDRPYPAEQILEVAGRTPGYDVLILIDDEFPNGFREIRDQIYLNDGMEFSARPPTGQATAETNAEQYFNNLTGDSLPSPYREDDRPPTAEELTRKHKKRWPAFKGE